MYRRGENGRFSPKSRGANESPLTQQFEYAGSAAMEQLGGTLNRDGGAVEPWASELGGHGYLGNARRGARRPRAWSPMPIASQML